MVAPGKSPKEKVLHTRVPESLDSQIKALADALRVPVSSLVRNILEDSVSVIDSATNGIDETWKSVSRNVRSLSQRAKADQKDLRRGWSEFQSMLGESFKVRSKRQVFDGHSYDNAASHQNRSASTLFPDVIGWQALTLNIETACGRCERTLAPGNVGHVGVRDQPGRRIVICDECVPNNL